MSTLASQVASKLLKIQAIKLQPKNPFTWASGIKSPIYCDNRILLSYPEIRNFVKDGLSSKTFAFGEFDIIAGVATAGIPHGTLLADAKNKPFIYVRSKAKAHGRQNLIEGELKEGQKVLVVEDLISTGKSSMAAIEAIEKAGGQVIGLLAIFTYGFQKAKDLFTEKRIPVDTLTNYRNLLQEAEETNYITADEKMLLENWNNNPVKWAEQITK